MSADEAFTVDPETVRPKKHHRRRSSRRRPWGRVARFFLGWLFKKMG